jgi:hypothetical protein
VKEFDMPNTPDLECLLARNPKDRDDVYRLRFTCYHRNGSIDYSEDERFSDAFDLQPNSFSFLVRGAAEPLATVRLTVVRNEEGWEDSPVQHVYGDDLAMQQMASESYVEASRLCFGPQARRGAFLKLVGYMAAMADFYETEWLVACPREEHVHTYEKLFGFRALAPARQYFGVKFKTQLLATHREKLRSHIRGDQQMGKAWAAALNSLVRAHIQARAAAEGRPARSGLIEVAGRFDAATFGAVSAGYQHPVYE